MRHISPVEVRVGTLPTSIYVDIQHTVSVRLKNDVGQYKFDSSLMVTRSIPRTFSRIFFIVKGYKFIEFCYFCINIDFRSQFIVVSPSCCTSIQLHNLTIKGTLRNSQVGNIGIVSVSFMSFIHIKYNDFNMGMTAVK